MERTCQQGTQHEAPIRASGRGRGRCRTCLRRPPLGGLSRRSAWRRAAGAAWALGLLLVGLASAEEPIQGEFYQILPGDTCQDIVRRAGGTLTLEAFHALNPDLVGPGPHFLEPEKRVRVRPSTEALPEAEITEVRPEVKAVLVGQAPVDARPGQPLKANDQVWTGKDASSEVTFQDSSYLQLHENSILVVYGRSSSQTAVKTRAVKLEAGTVSGGLASLRGGQGAPLRLETPAAQVHVASPELQVEVDAQKNSLVSVHQGQAQVSARGKTVTVEAAHGTVTRLGRAPEAPRALPEAPEWQTVPDALLRVDASEGGGLTLTWKPVARAASYRVEWAADRLFRRDVRLRGVRETRTVLPVRPGRYFVRVAARDGSGLIGPFSSTASVAVVRLALLDGRSQALAAEEGRGGAAARADVLVARGGLSVSEADGGPGLTFRLSPLGRSEGAEMVIRPGLTVQKPGIYVLSIQEEGSARGATAVLVRLVISILPEEGTR